VVTAATASLSARTATDQRLPPSASYASASGSPQPFRGPLDFAALRRQVTLQQVLQHLGVLHRFRNSSGWGSQLRGPCLLHQSRSERGRTFSIDLQRNIFRCFNPSCAARGNVLDLWAAYHDLPLHAAALHLAETFGVIPPRLENGSQTQNREEEPVTLQWPDPAPTKRASRPPTTLDSNRYILTVFRNAQQTTPVSVL
jgi:hypothetical protein